MIASASYCSPQLHPPSSQPAAPLCECGRVAARISRMPAPSPYTPAQPPTLALRRRGFPRQHGRRGIHRRHVSANPDVAAHRSKSGETGGGADQSVRAEVAPHGAHSAPFSQVSFGPLSRHSDAHPSCLSLRSFDTSRRSRHLVQYAGITSNLRARIHTSRLVNATAPDILGSRVWSVCGR